MSSAKSVVGLYDCDDLSAHHCGYCNQDGNISVGMSSELMRIDDYQLLIDRGWRRSGTYIYKPSMDKTCCPLYTIKNDAFNFQMSKSQKKILKDNRRYLDTNEMKDSKPSKPEIQNQATTSLKTEETIQQNNKECIECPKTNATKVMEYIINKADANDSKTETDINDLIGISKIKSKHKRLYRKLLALKEKNLIKTNSDIKKHLKERKNSSCSSHQSNNLESLIESKVNNQCNKLELKMVRSWPPTKEFQSTLKEEHELYAKYQTEIHKDSPLECNMKQFQRFLCTSPLIPLSYNGPLNKTGPVPDHPDLIDIGYGSFHQQYRLNGKLIAVGVLDILDHCVSSVYFFYDPQFQFLNLGTYSAMREIELVRQLNKLDSAINWYYLGFYTHTCKKMRYKGNFKPSFLACPEVFTWHPIEECLQKLETKKYSRFAPESSNDSNENTEIDSIKIRVKFRDSEMKIFKFSEFCTFLNPSFVEQFNNLIKGYSKLFGCLKMENDVPRTLVQSMVLENTKKNPVRYPIAIFINAVQLAFASQKRDMHIQLYPHNSHHLKRPTLLNHCFNIFCFGRYIRPLLTRVNLTRSKPCLLALYVLIVIWFFSLIFVIFNCFNPSSQWKQELIIQIAVLLIQLALLTFGSIKLFTVSIRDPSILARSLIKTSYELIAPLEDRTQFFDLPETAVNPKFEKPPVKKNISFDGKTVEVKLCELCQFYRLEKTVHCLKCNACIAEQYGHSSWLGKCIGKCDSKGYYQGILSWLLMLVIMTSNLILMIDRFPSGIFYASNILILIMMFYILFLSINIRF